MQPVLLSQQVRNSEQRWANQHKRETWPLMSRAATSFVRQFLSAISPGPVLVLVGSGNNGGDGYLIAKMLLEERVKVELVNPLGPPAAHLDAAQARELFLIAGGQEKTEIPDRTFHCVIDALFGSGLSRVLSDSMVALIERVNALELPTYSVDVPSGLNADTGVAMPVAIRARATHSFIALKPGLLTAQGPSVCGQLTLDTLGVPVETGWYYDTQVTLPARVGNTYKSQHGSVRVIGGRLNMAGAAIISASSALKAGAGRVYVCCDPVFFPAAIATAPELMMQDDVIESTLSDSITVIGPGLGRDDFASQLLQKVIGHPWARGVLDADALRLVSEQDLPFNGAHWVLTPHEGEAAALLKWPVEHVQRDRVKAVLVLQEKYQATVVLKGAGSLVISNDSPLNFCHAGDPAMATPGMGDCLAGLIGALAAQGMPLFAAAKTGVNWHASLGAELAKTRRVVLATDIIQCLSAFP